VWKMGKPKTFSGCWENEMEKQKETQGRVPATMMERGFPAKKKRERGKPADKGGGLKILETLYQKGLG